MSTKILTGDCRKVLATIGDGAVQCCVTSPPYFRLRDYGIEGQIGIESSPDKYVSELVGVFRQVWRVLRDDGTLWLNLGDSYSKKSLLGIPWTVALALREEGWYIRSAVVWHKPNPIPDPTKDRPTSAHEMIFLLTKKTKYFYDGQAIAEASVQPDRVRADRVGGSSHKQRQQHSEGGLFKGSKTRNSRNVWTVNTQPFPEGHFATMPQEIAARCILAGSAQGDTVLDPFGGSGTTAFVSERLGRNAIIIELNEKYVAMARKRVGSCSGRNSSPNTQKSDPVSIYPSNPQRG